MSSEATTVHASISLYLPSISLYLPSTSTATSTPTSFRSRESGLIRGSILSNLRQDYDKDAFKSIRDMLDTLHAAGIPGPQLLRMQTDFKSRTGRGAQVSVHVAHLEYKDQLRDFIAYHFNRFYIKFDVSLVLSLTDFSIGFSTLICGAPRLAQWLLLGSVLCDSLLTFGCSILVAGLRLSESLVLCPTPALSIGTFAYLPAALAWFVGTDASNLQQTNGQQDLISRAAAIICIVLSAAYVYFRYVTHSKLFDYSEVDEFVEPVRRFHPWPGFIKVPAEIQQGISGFWTIERRAKMLLSELYKGKDYYTYIPICWALGSFIISLAGLIAATFCVGHAASHLTLRLTFLAGSFAIPLAVRSLYVIHAAVMAYNNGMDQVCDLTLGPTRRMVMLTGPLWTIISWIWGLDFVLLLDMHQIILWGLTLFILFFTPQLFYKTNIMIGIVFICLYAMMVLSMFLRPEDSL